MADISGDAQRLYDEAVERRDAILAAWEELGRPTLAEKPDGTPIEHPHLRMLRQHDLLIDKLAMPLKRAHRGPQASAVVKASIGSSPAVKLRRVQ